MASRSPWPFVIAGALALHVVASLMVVYVATSNPSYAVEENYYQKALQWDVQRAQDRANADLGWALEVSAAPPTSRGGYPILEVRLADSAGAPVEDAEIALEAFHNARSDDIIRTRLEAADGGIYRAAVPMRRNGRWELRFTVERGGEHFTHRETTHLFVEGSW